MANANGWGDGASNNDIGWGKGADNAIGWGSVYSVSSAGLTDIIGTPAVDPDAQAFITAASITDPTQQSAINQLVVDLKGYNVWTKMKALYPFVGGTAAQHKWNLKDPRDLDAAHRILWSGGVTHSSNGVQFGGINGFGDTNFNPSTNSLLNSTHFSFYSRTITASNIFEVESGVTSSSNALNLLSLRVSNITYAAINSAATYTTFSDSDSRAFYIANRTASNALNIWRNSVKAATGTTASNTLPNGNHWLGAFNNIPSPGSLYYSTKQCAFASIGDGLTDTEAANFYTAVQAFQVTLGRSIGTQTVSDADAQAFVTNAGIVDQVEANAVNNLVIGLKADGLWTKMSAIYPMVGGSNTSTSYNLRNTAQYQISWQGGVTSSANGVQFNGMNSYGITGYNPSTSATLNSHHLSFYSRTNSNGTEVEFGSIDAASGNGSLVEIRTSGVTYLRVNNGTGTITFSDSDSRAFYIANRTASNVINGWRNSTKAVNGTLASSSLGLREYYLGAFNNNTLPSFYSTKQCAFASIGDGLSDAEVTNFYNRVQTFNTALARQV